MCAPAQEIKTILSAHRILKERTALSVSTLVPWRSPDVLNKYKQVVPAMSLDHYLGKPWRHFRFFESSTLDQSRSNNTICVFVVFVFFILMRMCAGRVTRTTAAWGARQDAARENRRGAAKTEYVLAALEREGKKGDWGKLIGGFITPARKKRRYPRPVRQEARRPWTGGYLPTHVSMASELLLVCFI